jgi:hypothetical protein
MDFANGEISFQCLRLIGSGPEHERLLGAAEVVTFTPGTMQLNVGPALVAGPLSE